MSDPAGYEDSILQAYGQGRQHAAENGGPDGCPYYTHTEQGMAWMSGYRDKTAWDQKRHGESQQ